MYIDRNGGDEEIKIITIGRSLLYNKNFLYI